MKGSQLLSFWWDCSTNLLIKISGSVLLFHNPALYLPCQQRITDRINSDFVFTVLLPAKHQMNCCFIVTCDVMATQEIKLYWPNCWVFNILQHDITGPHYFLTAQIILLLKCIRQTASNISTSLIATFMGPTWGPSGADRTQVGPMLAPWTLLSGMFGSETMTNYVFYQASRITFQ